MKLSWRKAWKELLLELSPSAMQGAKVVAKSEAS